MILFSSILFTIPEVDAASPKASGSAPTVTFTTSPGTFFHTVLDGTNRLLIVNVGIKDVSSPMATISSVTWGTSCSANTQSFMEQTSASKTINAGTNDGIRTEIWTSPRERPLGLVHSKLRS